MTLFDWLKEITYIKSPWKKFNSLEKETYSPYMIHRYISMYEPYIDIANVVQRINPKEKEKIYKLYLNLLPKNQVYLNYIKSKKKNKVNSDLVEYISKYYECSLAEAEDYIYILGDKGVTDKLNKIGIEPKQIKKLLK